MRVEGDFPEVESLRNWLATLFVAAALLAGCSKPPAPVEPEKPVEAPAPVVVAPEYQPGEKHKEALALLGAEEYWEAEKILTQLVKDEPRNADAWNDLSFVQSRIMKYAQAAAAAQQALLIRPGFVYAQYNLGWALLQTNDWGKAKAPLEASMKAQPDRPEPIYAMGRWHERAGNLQQALEFYEKAAGMGDERAKSEAASLTRKEEKRKAADEAIARFPEAPAGVIRSVMEGWYPEGVTRTLLRVLPVRFSRDQEARWAVLVEDRADAYVSFELEVRSAEASGTMLDGYLGSCSLSLPPSAEQAEVESVPHATGEHLLLRSSGQAVVCGPEDKNVTELFRTKSPISSSSEGLLVDGQPYKFVTETSEYLPAATADQVQGLVAEIRAAGNPVLTRTAVRGAGDVTGGGKSAQLLAWHEDNERGGTLAIAVKVDGERMVLLRSDKVLYTQPHHVGAVSAPGHTFLAVATYQIGAPNGGDVLVLKYDQAARTFREVFHANSDSAGFDKEGPYTTFKKYRSEGGYDLHLTAYTWDETKGTFVPSKTEAVSPK